MNDRPARRLLDRLAGSANFIDASTRITGDFETDGSLILCGRILGDGRVGGALSMARSSEWQGEVHIENAVIAGTVIGKLVVENKVEIGSAAVIRGDVVARSIAIARGAVIEGELTVTGGEPVATFEEKRQG